eukprot:TRINITY_DN15554_c0_g1_i1.p1 TRINITY_DN15554_c0_g1~~TRINITY_DN15554_c0_g1_i1.p1  ORF type:complete len:60 (+),score=2.66 TRINITY_DN15554_c0_g1_i1:20-199(+)
MNWLSSFQVAFQNQLSDTRDKTIENCLLIKLNCSHSFFTGECSSNWVINKQNEYPLSGL